MRKWRTEDCLICIIGFIILFTIPSVFIYKYNTIRTYEDWVTHYKQGEILRLDVGTQIDNSDKKKPKMVDTLRFAFLTERKQYIDNFSPNKDYEMPQLDYKIVIDNNASEVTLKYPVIIHAKMEYNPKTDKTTRLEILKDNDYVVSVYGKVIITMNEDDYKKVFSGKYEFENAKK